jgi:hypothetical protein
VRRGRSATFRSAAQWSLRSTLRFRSHALATSPSRHAGARQRDLYAALPSASVQHVKCERKVAEVEVGVNLDVNFVSPRVLKVSLPSANAIVATVDGAADRTKHRLNLDLRVAQRDQRV